MNIIILGAGQIGSSLAGILSVENHDVAIVDLDAKRLHELQEHYDVRTVVGRATYPDVLRQAGADNCDMIIAVTNRDEVNMVACQVAYSLFNIPKKIARIRSPHYFIRKELFGQDNLPIDIFISPEHLIMESVAEVIRYPGALQVLNFAEGKLKMVAVKPYYGGPMLGKNIADLPEFISAKEVNIVAIFRDDHFISLSPGTSIELGDEVFFVCKASYVNKVIAALRTTEDPYKKMIISDGGDRGLLIAKTLSEKYQIKLIDHNHERCKRLVNRLDNVMVLCGDICDKSLLINENIEKTDVFCAVTGDDEENILSCMQAKRLGAKLVIALVNRTAYMDLIEGGQINIILSPQQITVGSILTHVRRGDVVNVYALRHGDAEVMEVVAHGDSKHSKVVGRHLNEIKIPKEVFVNAVVRGNKVFLPNEDLVIEEGDHVVLFVRNKKYLSGAEGLFL